MTLVSVSGVELISTTVFNLSSIELYSFTAAAMLLPAGEEGSRVDTVLVSSATGRARVW